MSDREWAQEIAEKIAKKVSETARRSGTKVPYSTIEGRFDDWSGERIGWWTNGFWIGMLWQLYYAFEKEEFKENAEALQEKLDTILMDYMPMDHDAGFRFLLTDVANYKMTGDKKSRNNGILAAANMAGRFNLKAGLIRAWNDPGDGGTAGLAIIDCMMNLPLLYWASDELKDPRFKHIAMAHADMTKKVFVRADGSVHHIIEFDPETGDIIKPLGGQGMAEGSAWTRGQSWALYGFTLSYIHTKNISYLETGIKVADYVISKIADNGVIPVDFDQPKDILWEDSTAAAIFSCGLLELEKYVDKEKSEKYHQAAMKLLKTLTEHRCDFTMEKDNIVEKCSAAYHDKEHDFSIIYGDYYYTEAILKLAEKELMMW